MLERVPEGIEGFTLDAEDQVRMNHLWPVGTEIVDQVRKPSLSLPIHADHCVNRFFTDFSRRRSDRVSLLNLLYILEQWKLEKPRVRLDNMRPDEIE
jgi:hypothetical protein